MYSLIFLLYAASGGELDPKRLKAIDESSVPQWLKTLRKLPLQLGIVGDLWRLYLIKPIDAEATREMVL